jgi:formiminotetrahydrofolate cyclodeaminase
MIKQQTIEQDLADLASSRSTPGGGSAAALIGAMGAALVSMVCNLTVGKEKYADVEAELNEVLAQSERLRVDLTDLADRDIIALRQTDEQKQARTQAIQAALKQAAIVSLEIVAACRAIISLSKPTVEKGNLNVISDAGVAVVSAAAGLKAAALNVIINLGFIKDEAFVHDKQQELDSLLADQEMMAEAVYRLVKAKLQIN